MSFVNDSTYRLDDIVFQPMDLEYNLPNENLPKLDGYDYVYYLPDLSGVQKHWTDDR